MFHMYEATVLQRRSQSPGHVVQVSLATIEHTLDILLPSRLHDHAENFQVLLGINGTRLGLLVPHDVLVEL